MKCARLAACLVTLALAQCASAEALYDDNIEITINHRTASDFFPVYIDINNEKAEPYLPINKTFALFEIPVTCKKSNQSCELTIPTTGNTYWFDLKQYTHGMIPGKDSSAKPTQLKLNKDLFTFKDKQYWLRTDAWETLFPVELYWDLDRYTVNIAPKFKDLAALKKERQKRLIAYNYTRSKEKALKEAPLLTPSQKYNLQGQYTLSASSSSKSKQSLELGGYTTVDIFSGTLKLAQTLVLQHGETPDFSNLNWSYTRQDLDGKNKWQLGSTSTQGSPLLVKTTSIKNGFSYSHLPFKHYGGGRWAYNGITQPGTVIWVWHNGLLNVINADAQGHYELSAEGVGSNDVIEVEYYYPNGASSKETFVTASDPMEPLEQQQWNLQLSGGTLTTTDPKNTGDQYYQVTGQYGLFNHVNVRTDAYRFPDKTTAFGLSAGARLFTGSSIYYEFLNYPDGNDNAVQLSLTEIPNHDITVTYRNLQADSPVFSLSLPPTVIRSNNPINLNQTNIGPEWTVQDRFYLLGLSLTGNYVYTQNYYAFDAGLLIKPNNWLSMQINAGAVDFFNSTHAGLSTGFNFVSTARLPYNMVLTWTRLMLYNLPDDVVTDQVRIAQQTELSGYQLQPNITINRDNDGNIFAQGDVKLRTPIKLNPFVQFTQTSDNSSNLSGGIEWKIHKFLRLSVAVNDEEVLGTFFVSQAFGLSAPITSPSQYGSATMSGYLMQPERDGEPAEPLDNVKVIVGNASAYTDEKGFFTISGITPYERMPLTIDETTLDATLKLAKSNLVFMFRPASHVDYNPILSWTSGIDGQLYFTNGDPLPMDLMIEAYDATGQLVSSAEVDPELGFYILENLTPGDYELKVIGSKRPAPQPFKVNIPKGEDWVSGVDLAWDNGLPEGQEEVAKTIKDKPASEVQVQDKEKRETQPITQKKAEPSAQLLNDKDAKESAAVQILTPVYKQNIDEAQSTVLKHVKTIQQK